MIVHRTIDFCPKCLWACQKTAPTFRSPGNPFNSKHGMQRDVFAQSSLASVTPQPVTGHGHVSARKRCFTEPGTKPGLFTEGISSTVILAPHQLYWPLTNTGLYKCQLIVPQGVNDLIALVKTPGSSDPAPVTLQSSVMQLQRILPAPTPPRPLVRQHRSPLWFYPRLFICVYIHIYEAIEATSLGK